MQFKSNPFSLIVRTNMPKTEFLGYDEERKAYLMSVHEKPEKGKANLEIIRFFRKEFKMDVRIISGMTSKHKLVKIL